MKNKFSLFWGVITLIFIIFLYLVYSNKSVSDKQQKVEISTNGNETKVVEGKVTQIDSTQKLYENNQLGLKFYFPSAWHLAKDTLGDSSQHGYLQLFNYDEGSVNGKGFQSLQNKIELTITNNYSVATSSDYPEKTRVETNFLIKGITATSTDVTLSDQQSYRVITIPMKSAFLKAVVYGDPKNFEVLNVLIKSIAMN